MLALPADIHPAGVSPSRLVMPSIHATVLAYGSQLVIRTYPETKGEEAMAFSGLFDIFGVDPLQTVSRDDFLREIADPAAGWHDINQLLIAELRMPFGGIGVARVDALPLLYAMLQGLENISAKDLFSIEVGDGFWVTFRRCGDAGWAVKCVFGSGGSDIDVCGAVELSHGQALLCLLVPASRLLSLLEDHSVPIQDLMLRFPLKNFLQDVVDLDCL